MSNDRGPSRRLNIPEQTPPPATGGSRRISVPDQTPPPAPAAAPQSGSRRLNIPDQPIPPAPPPAAPRTRSAINPTPLPPAPPAPPPKAPKPATLTDRLIEKAKTIDPSVQMHRLRGRIDTLLTATLDDVMDWGKRNLEPLQDTSNRKAKIAVELSRINAIGWLQEAKEASSMLPKQQAPTGFWGKLTGGGQPAAAPKSPDFYENMLKKTKDELRQFVTELNKLRGEFFREIGDLHCDAISMLVVLEEYQDDYLQSTADNRARTLLGAHQAAAMLQQTIENSLKLATDQIHQIESFLSVTLPQWRMAHSKS